MQEIQAHFVELANKSDKSIPQIAKEAVVGESTVRRFLRGEDISVNSLGKIAAAIGGTTVDLDGLIPDKTAVAVEIVKHEVKQEIEQEFKPYSPHCATDCTARKAFNENLAHITELYEKRLDERKELYEARLAEQKALYERSLAIKNTQLDKRDAEIVTLNQKHEAAIATLNAEHAKEIADIRARKDIHIARFRKASYLLLGLFVAAIIFAIYLMFVDFPNPTWGIFQYPTAYWDNIVPQAFGL